MYNLTQVDISALTPSQRAELQRVCTIEGPELIVRLLKDKGLNPSSFARKHGFPASSVYACIRTTKPLPEIRAALSAELGFPEQVLFSDAEPQSEAA